MSADGQGEMIDLHCHLLPGIDDGAADLAESLTMARQAVADGIAVVACTPHAYPGLYDNRSEGIRAAVAQLQGHLQAAGIPLELTTGADIHLVPEVLQGLREGTLPTLGGSRYFLLEPAHHVPTPRFAEQVWNLLASGYVPIVTHPERLAWIERHYPVFLELARQGAWMQITGDSLLGGFGRRARYWAERMLDDGVVHLLASDGHGARRRPVRLAAAREAAAKRVGEAEAWRLVRERPRQVLADAAPETVPAPPALRVA